MKKSIAASLAALVLASSTTADAQEKPWAYIESSDLDPSLHLAVFGTNLAINGTICGITALIENRNGIKDIGQCLGGTTLQFAGMELASYGNEIPVLPGMAYRVTELGTSMVENTLAGRESLERLHWGFGPGLLQIDFKERAVDLYLRALPMLGMVFFAVNESTFSWKDSLNFQNIVFHRPYGESDETHHYGNAVGNVMVYDPKYPDPYRVHEFNHVLQYVRTRPFQLVMPDILEERLHYRGGEDALFSILTLQSTICYLADEHCDRTKYNPAEIECYIMETTKPYKEE